MAPQKVIGRTALAFLLAGTVADRVLAHEIGDFQQYVRGFTISDPLGAVPPPGLYFENTGLYVPNAPGNGQLGTVRANAILDTPTLFWSTGYSFLGASVAASISQPFYQATVWANPTPGPPFTGATVFPTFHNTWINPIDLSWNLGNGWFGSLGFDFYVPDGSHYIGTLNPDYWTYEPRGSLSYLGNGWDLTATLFLNFNSPSHGTSGSFAGTPAAIFGVGYKSGDQAFLDVTATHKYGQWEIGPVAYFAWQMTNDQPGGRFTCAQLALATAGTATCGRANDYALGALVGYDFGPANLRAYFTDAINTRDNFGGLFVWTKLSFRLWAPEQPAAEPAKKTSRRIVTK